MKHYYNKTKDEVLSELETKKEGLSTKEVQSKILKYGKNELLETQKKSILVVFLEQFKDLLVAILVVAAIVSAFSGSIESTVVIIAVLILNAVLGTVQHVKAEKSLESLKQMSSPNAKVLRDGNKIEIKSSEVVLGDILVVDAGDMIVADGRLIENYSLQVNESSLTGESESVNKTVDTIEQEKIPLGDMENMVFSGSFVTYGHALVVVTKTGMNTEIGKIASLMNKTKEKRTPLQISLDKFSKRLATAIMIICAVIFVIQWIQKPENPMEALLFAVALAVAAIPEALSSIVTIVQAMGTQKMVKEHAIIKELKAVETLGCVSVICSDKTGTLTQNKMTVKKVYTNGILKNGEELDSQNNSDKILLDIMVLTNDSIINENQELGDPTEVALVAIANKLGISEEEKRIEIERKAEIPFDSDRKLMSTVHEIDGKLNLFTKGALDTILDRSTKILTKQGVKPIDDADKNAIIDTNISLSRQGLRVLTFAYKEIESYENLSIEDENDYIFVGLVAMIDPPREESKKAVFDAKQAGIKTVMITGDHKITASAIAAQIGIMGERDTAVTGVELDQMSDEQLKNEIENISVYARVSPENKIRIVNAWQEKGRVVAMTGDGVNDAPALKKADIGVAMGVTGTEVSKDASAMILTDDNFATIVKSVRNGRNVYANIKNAIKFLLSGNMAAIFAVLYTAVIPGLVAPFVAVQLLFINLLTDSLPALAIGMENSKDDLLKQPPRDPKVSILDNSTMRSVIVQGFLIAIVTMIAYYIGFAQQDKMAMTMAFCTLTLARLFHGFNCRGSKDIFKLGLLSNKYSIMAFLAGVFLLGLVMFVPYLMRVFSVEAMSLAQVLWVVILAFAPTVVIQITKIIRGLKKSK